ncbi:MAG: O-linked N-acetylglucosamine transferase, SPINDLY family protein [Coleofasciculaceae cyanobacterium SM2_1_6]|nr:O-linked N-acetylglucosamine transferase, SPINDLY family protein [Coleofasciculaceae cyanobacterium SM2_1_6]
MAEILNNLNNSSENQLVISNLEQNKLVQNNVAIETLNQANTLYFQQDYQGAIEAYEKFLTLGQGDWVVYHNLGCAYKQSNDYYRGINAYYRGLIFHPNNLQLYKIIIGDLLHYGYTEEAKLLATKALEIFPEDIQILSALYLSLPQFYGSTEEVEFHRQRFNQGLHKFINSFDLNTPEGLSLALQATYTANFNLLCQGKSDRYLNQIFGNFVHEVVSKVYPQWTKELPTPPLTTTGKIKIGYLANTLHPSGIFTLIMGWIRNANREKFAIYCYYTGNRIEEFYSLFNPYCDHAYHLPYNLESIAQQINQDHLHILVLATIGMEPLMTPLAALRLAPVQCTTWLHPVTTGLPNVDYFLSSELMETPEADLHYTEKLIRVKGVGLSCGQLITKPYPTKSRSAYNFSESAIIYLSCQSIFKYLPEYDYVFPEIVQQVPNAQILFLASTVNQVIAQKFIKRLEIAFAAYNLDFHKYCQILPLQNSEDYSNLFLLSDVFLDTFSWSGGSTSLIALYNSLPIVTHPGKLARGRYSYGILQRMGLTETIAYTEAEYIEIAVRLGLDSQWRQQVSDRILPLHKNLGDSEDSIQYLEEFYQQLIREKLSYGS